MRLFGRSRPIHRQLADDAGLSLDETGARSAGPAAAPPGWDGEQRGEAGIHGVPRARAWDVVAPVDAPALRGDTVHFVALPDGTLVVEEDEPDDALAPLADAVESRLRPPYRAEAVRRSGSSWSVGARSVQVVRETALDGDEAELVVTAAGSVLTVDGRTHVARAPALTAAGAAHGQEYVVRASRLDDELWEVEASAL